MTCDEFRQANVSTAKFFSLTRAERLASAEHLDKCVGCYFWIQLVESDPDRDYEADIAECQRLWKEDHQES